MEGGLECSRIRTVSYANHGVLIDNGPLVVGAQQARIWGLQAPL